MFDELTPIQRAQILGCLESADSALTRAWSVNRRGETHETVSESFDSALRKVTSELNSLIVRFRDSL